MCGISVLISSVLNQSHLRERLEGMLNTLAHRGPDGAGTNIFMNNGPSVALGHRRLSIIDLACGQQPMSNEDGTIWITYNGEIYNHLDLRQQLEARGHKYKSHCDTETIIHAYEEWGQECVTRLHGMFAFAIWNQRNRSLFAARDRLGVKPLYYATSKEAFLLASEMKAIIASGTHPARLNSAAVPELMTFGYLAGKSTLFDGVNTLLPGHRLTWENGVVDVQQYWDVPLSNDRFSCRDEESLVEEFQSLFDAAVRMRLMSDVPLGVFLSGGLDSTSIAVSMAKHMATPLKTFSVGYESPYYSELSFAREASESIGADHHEIILRAPDLIRALPNLIWHEDKPIRNASSIALYYVSSLAREFIKVVLTGEGSDELFAGYARYQATIFNQRWGRFYEGCVPRLMREDLIRRSLWKWPLPLSFKRKLSHTFLNHSMRPEEIIFDNFHSIVPQRDHVRLFTADFYEVVRGSEPYSETMHLYNSRGEDELDRLLYTDQKTYLVELLMKQDRMSMAASIESRVPFLDHKLVEFAARLPAKLKLHRRGEKYIVKRAMYSQVPKSILERPKMGFPVPIEHWQRNDFSNIIRGVLLSQRALERNIFDRHYVAQLLSEDMSGSRDHAAAIWTLLNFELWARIFLDGEPREHAASELLTVSISSNKPHSAVS